MRRKRFKHVVSLGWFCSPAQELERLGYRQFSGPFDWLLAWRLENVLSLLDREAAYFPDCLYQYMEHPNWYHDDDLKISYYHDFAADIPIDEQIDSVRAKYARRFERFYQQIKEPTLFIRYVRNQDELNYIRNNSGRINRIIKKRNENSGIVYVVNNEFNLPHFGEHQIIISILWKWMRAILFLVNFSINFLNLEVLYNKTSKYPHMVI